MTRGVIAHKEWNPQPTESVYTFLNQGLPDPVMARVDPTNLALPSFTTDAIGVVRIQIDCWIESTNSSADTFLRWGLMTDATTVLAPLNQGANGRRAELHNDIGHNQHLDFVYQLTPLTAYTLYWGACCGNQAAVAPNSANMIMKAGGLFGQASMRVWELAGVP